MEIHNLKLKHINFNNKSITKLFLKEDIEIIEKEL